jgi:osmotically-inducible protein OsmY
VKTDAQLKKELRAELEWAASVNAAQVGVVVKDGVVTLSGHLNTFAEKLRCVVRSAPGPNGWRQEARGGLHRVSPAWSTSCE